MAVVARADRVEEQLSITVGPAGARGLPSPSFHCCPSRISRHTPAPRGGVRQVRSSDERGEGQEIRRTTPKYPALHSPRQALATPDGRYPCQGGNLGCDIICVKGVGG